MAGDKEDDKKRRNAGSSNKTAKDAPDNTLAENKAEESKSGAEPPLKVAKKSDLATAMAAAPIPSVAPKAIQKDIASLQKAQREMTLKINAQSAKIDTAIDKLGKETNDKMDTILEAIAGRSGPSKPTVAGQELFTLAEINDDASEHERDDYDDPFKSDEEKDDKEKDKVSDVDEMVDLSAFSKGGKEIENRIAPSSLGIKVWAQARRVSAEYGPDEWKSAKLQFFIKKYTNHPKALPFKAHDVDHNVEPLEWQKEKDLEKNLLVLQGAVGAAANMTAGVLDVCNEMIASILETV